MKRLRSSDDLDSFEQKGVFKDWGRKNDESSMSRSSSHRNFQYKSENGRRGSSSSLSSRYDRVEDDRENPRSIRKRSDYEDGYDRYKDGSERGILSSSPRSGYSGERVFRSESFSRSPRREIPKGFRSERDRPRRESSVSSWQRFGVGKDIDDSTLGENPVGSQEKVNMRFSRKDREEKSPRKDYVIEQTKSIRMKDSGNERSKEAKIKDSGNEHKNCTNMILIKKKRLEKGCSSEMEEGELEPEPELDPEPESEPKARGKYLISQNKLKIEEIAVCKMVESEAKSVSLVRLGKDGVGREEREKGGKSLPELKSDKKGVCEEKKKIESHKSVEDLVEDCVGQEKREKGVKFLPELKSNRDGVSERSLNIESQKSVEDLVKDSVGREERDKGVKTSPELKSSKDDIREKKMKFESQKSSEYLVKEKREKLAKSLPELKPIKDGVSDKKLKFESQKSAEGLVKEKRERLVKSLPELKPIRDGVCEKKLKFESQINVEDLVKEKREKLVKSLPELNPIRDGVCEKKLKFESQKSIKDLVKDGVGREERDERVKSLPELKSIRSGVSEEKTKFESQKSVENLVKSPDKSARGQRSPIREDAFETTEKMGEKKINPIEELMPMRGKHEEGSSVNLVIEIADTSVTDPNTSVCEGSERVYNIIPSFKEKGKNVVASPSNATSFQEKVVEIPRESKNVLNFEPDDIEGPSIRGLNLFIDHPVKQPEKQNLNGFGKAKDEKLELEPFDLSLSLPNVLLPIDYKGPAPSSLSSFRSNSDGFTASFSLTGSQSFNHNASCSLTNNPFDQFENSVNSRPLFGKIDQISGLIWQGGPSNECNRKDFPILNKALSNGNGSNRDLSLHRQLSTNSRQSSGSHENRSEYSNDKNRVMRERVSSSLYKENNRVEENFFKGADSVEPIITMIVSEPVHVMTKKFNEMNEQAIITLKEGVRDIVVNAGKKWQLSLFQKALINKFGITLEMLLKANRAQLEILVALKTGVSEFLLKNQNISSSDMAEIYLNLRCRNLTCRNLLPVDECDCKICSQNNGFCSNCMCLVCSKYDMASNTCSWVGCDVCLHWCHTDCAIRESYIRNGRISYGTHENKEMQFHCVACDHPSEMFGFVKEVFQTFAMEWNGEKLSKELEYVEKIFSGSEDTRGKRLHDIALLMLSRLANKCDFREVQNQIMSFLAESSSVESDNPTVRSGKQLFNNTNEEGNNNIKVPSQEAAWLKPLHSEKAPQLEKSSSFLDLQRNTQKDHTFDELESIVRIKEAEAKMFQTRADDARREAEGLKRIATAKNKNIEEEYSNRITKLRLLEAEEKKKQKIEDLQAIEKAYREYFNMKMRMEADIRDLLLKMEATKRNLAL